MTDKYTTIYDLKRDEREIMLVQNASLHRDDCGLATSPALFGSAEWFGMVGTDALPVHTLEGKITRVYMSGHNDFPEFEMDDGVEKTKWMRRGENPAYIAGRRIRIRYVEMKWKRPLKGLGPTDECVLTVEVGIEKEISQGNN